MVYNLTGIAQNTSDILTFTQGVNTELMSGMLGVVFLAGIFMVLVAGFIFTTRDTPKSIAAGSFITFLFSLLFLAMDLIPLKFLYVFLVLAAGGVAFIWKTS